MTALIDLSGQTFGRWTVLRRSGPRSWLCRCECGAEVSVDGRSLRGGRSSGCISCHAADLPALKHGGKHTRLYGIWCGIIARCENPNEPAYKRYGGRGIAMCGEWRHSFAAFRSWAQASGYSDTLTIDRIDNDGNYEPGNCRWATYREQNRNYSRVHYVTIDGQRVPLIEAAERVGLKPYTVRQRIFRMGWSVQRALTTPVRGQPLVAAYTFTVEQRNIDQLARAA